MRSARPQRRTDSFYAVVAAVYCAELENPDGIYKAMSDRLHLSESTVLDYVKEARRRNLLTSAPGRGLKGGELTAKALELLTRPAIQIVEQEVG
jgi:DNA-binding IscR family transcriptional regulator